MFQCFNASVLSFFTQLCSLCGLSRLPHLTLYANACTGWCNRILSIPLLDSVRLLLSILIAISMFAYTFFSCLPFSFPLRCVMQFYVNLLYSSIKLIARTHFYSAATASCKNLINFVWIFVLIAHHECKTTASNGAIQPNRITFRIYFLRLYSLSFTSSDVMHLTSSFKLRRFSFKELAVGFNRLYYETKECFYSIAEFSFVGNENSGYITSDGYRIFQQEMVSRLSLWDSIVENHIDNKFIGLNCKTNTR